ncbi:hypothetical protein AAFN60_11650 [Roseibacillus persicicus]|uniref:hypothetical protein n=1 Tax=Roseibacillus persicicus TaxID=454148 RepID=UPI00398B34F7
MKTTIPLFLLAFTASFQGAAGVVLSEFEPNPAGGDPTSSSIELSGGSPLDTFDLWILSLENDTNSTLGTVDRASNVTGSYDANGFATVAIPDFENPSFTVILTDAFTGTIGDDLDPTDNGTVDLSSLGTVFDAVGVSDSTDDDTALYGATLGGTDILFNGEFEPLLVFRDGTTGDWFQTVTIDFGLVDERVGAFAAAGGPELVPSDFDSGSLAPTYGSVNPSFIPEPSAALLGGLGFLALLRRRR